MDNSYRTPKFDPRHVKMWDDMVSVTASGTNDIWGVAVTPTSITIPCEGFFVDTAGSFTFVTARGSTRTVTLTQGYHPGRIKQVTSGTGIWVFPP